MATLTTPASVLATVNSAVPPAVATLTGVTKRYGSTLALDDLSLSLRPGEIVALLGPNGAGKSTTVRLLLGLSSPNSGSVRIFGRDPRDPESRTRVGAMLQVAAVPKTLKVKEHIDLFRSYYPNPLPAEEIVRIAHLEGIENRLFEHLSGGQRQRLLFGLACAGNPDLIFLDEPTAGLDIEARRGLWSQIRALAAAGKTVLLTTHYLEEADSLAHRIIVVNKGRVVSEGTPAEIKSFGLSGIARRVRCATTLPAEFLLALPTVLSVDEAVETAAAATRMVTVTASHAEEVLRAMLAADPALHSLEVINPGLEDAFLALTAK